MTENGKYNLLSKWWKLNHICCHIFTSLSSYSMDASGVLCVGTVFPFSYFIPASVVHLCELTEQTGANFRRSVQFTVSCNQIQSTRGPQYLVIPCKNSDTAFYYGCWWHWRVLQVISHITAAPVCFIMHFTTYDTGPNGPVYPFMPHHSNDIE
jgi:hypothetical protein